MKKVIKCFDIKNLIMCRPVKAGDVVDAVLIVDGNVLLDEVEQRHHEKGDLTEGRRER